MDVIRMGLNANYLSKCYSCYKEFVPKKKTQKQIAREWHYGFRVRYNKNWNEIKYIQSRKIIYKSNEIKQEKWRFVK